MKSDWSSPFEAVASLFVFALGTQCVLAWIYALLFRAFLRGANDPPYFRAWTWAWFARASALSVILVLFTVQLGLGQLAAVDASAFSMAGYALYQSGKLLANWWVLEGVLRFVGASPSRVRTIWMPALLVLAALASVLWSDEVKDLLMAQSPLVVGTSLVAAQALLRVAPARRGAGTRITAAALIVQAGLWGLYFFIYLGVDRRAWPLVRTPASFVAAHNSFFDLVVDVLLASGLVVLLLQDLHRRQLESETERTRLHGELGRAERLRSLGTLVSGVAHELNNPLAAILGFAEALGAPASEEERARQASIIREQALRCRRIVRGLSTFSGNGSEIFERIEVGALLDRVTSGFEFELLRRRMWVETRVPDSLPTLLADRFAIEQMVANLLANAIQASPNGKCVTLSAQANGRELDLIVEDHGPGIPAHAMAHVFDPFFTTRAPGEGMGLGLAVAHGIVSAHNGTIRAENRRPSGARLIVTLPLHARSKAGAEEILIAREIPRPPQRDRRPLELLVIEDEAMLCEMLAALGTRNGWHVTTANTGSAGLERLGQGGQRFDVVLCDLRMAAPSGIEIHDRIAAENPRLLERFLFVTGDIGSEEVADFTRRCARPILHKPFRIDELATKIEEMAASSAAAG